MPLATALRLGRAQWWNQVWLPHSRVPASLVRQTFPPQAARRTVSPSPCSVRGTVERPDPLPLSGTPSFRAPQPRSVRRPARPPAPCPPHPTPTPRRPLPSPALPTPRRPGAPAPCPPLPSNPFPSTRPRPESVPSRRSSRWAAAFRPLPPAVPLGPDAEAHSPLQDREGQLRGRGYAETLEYRPQATGGTAAILLCCAGCREEPLGMGGACSRHAPGSSRVGRAVSSRHSCRRRARSASGAERTGGLCTAFWAPSL